MVVDIEKLETMDPSESFSKRLSAKEVFCPRQNEKFILPVADGRKKSWRISGTENIHLDTGTPNSRRRSR